MHVVFSASQIQGDALRILLYIDDEIFGFVVFSITVTIILGVKF